MALSLLFAVGCWCKFRGHDRETHTRIGGWLVVVVVVLVKIGDCCPWLLLFLLFFCCFLRVDGARDLIDIFDTEGTTGVKWVSLYYISHVVVGSSSGGGRHTFLHHRHHYLFWLFLGNCVRRGCRKGVSLVSVVGTDWIMQLFFCKCAGTKKKRVRNRNLAQSRGKDDRFLIWFCCDTVDVSL